MYTMVFINSRAIQNLELLPFAKTEVIFWPRFVVVKCYKECHSYSEKTNKMSKICLFTNTDASKSCAQRRVMQKGCLLLICNSYLSHSKVQGRHGSYSFYLFRPEIAAFRSARKSSLRRTQSRLDWRARGSCCSWGWWWLQSLDSAEVSGRPHNDILRAARH